jgi:hypothetical protein
MAVKPKVKVSPPKVDVPTGGLPGVKPPKVDVPTGGLPGVKPPKDLSKVNKVKGKSDADIAKELDGKTLNGKTVDDLKTDPKVVDAAKKNSENLKKLGIKAAGLAAGLAALMILYGTANPIEAIKKAMEDAGETFDDATDFAGGIIDGIKKWGIAIGIGILALIILSVVGPMIFKMVFSSGSSSPAPQPYNQRFNAYPPRY